MKNKRWLFILLGILFLINISFFVITRFAKYDVWLIDKLVTMIDKELGTKTTIGTLVVTDRQLQLSDMEITDLHGSYQIKIKDIYVNYNLFNVIFSNLKLFKAVESISIIEPHILIQLAPNEKNKTEESEEKILKFPSIPDISDYFQILNVLDGSLTISYQDEFIEYRDLFSEIDLEVVNNKSTTMNLKVYRSKHDLYNHLDDHNYQLILPTLEVDLEALGTDLKRSTIQLHDYVPDQLSINQIDNLDFLIDLEATYGQNGLKVDGLIKNLRGEFKERLISAETIELFSYDERVFLHANDLILDGNLTLLDIELRDLNTTPDLNLTLIANKISLENYLPVGSGDVDMEVKLSGSLADPIGNLKIESDLITIGSEKIENFLLIGDYADHFLYINLQEASWQQNKINGRGSFSPELGLIFNINNDNLNAKITDFIIQTDLSLELSFKDHLSLRSNLNDLSIDYKDLTLRELKLEASIFEEEVTLLLAGERFNVSSRGNLNEKNFESTIEFQGLNLNEVIKYRLKALKTYPHLTGKVDISYDNKVLLGHSSLRMYNLIYGQFQGNIRTDLELDFLNDTSFFSLETANMAYHYEPLSIFIKGGGTTEIFSTELFKINQELEANFNIQVKPELKFSLNLRGEDLNLRRYLRYFITTHKANYFNGEVDLVLNVEYPDDINGWVIGKDFSYRKLGPYNSEFHFFMNPEQSDWKRRPGKIQFVNTIKTVHDEPLIVLNGTSILNSDFDIDIVAHIDNLSLSDVLPAEDITGLINSDLYLKRRDRNTEIGVDLHAYNCRYRWTGESNGRHDGDFSEFAVDTLHVKAIQADQILSIERLYAIKSNLYTANVQGNLGYNIITNRIYNVDEEMNFNFQGDLIQALANNIRVLESGRSDTEIVLNFGIRQDELTVLSGHLLLNNGILRVKDQPVRAENINLDFLFEENVMTINSFEARVGEGKLQIRNEIKDNENDFKIGMMNLGHFFVTNTQGGLSVHIPSYFPHGSSAVVSIRGRNGQEAEIIGPFDGIKVIADLYISNTSITYPSNTENLFKIINVARERRNDSVPQPLPFELDLRLIAQNQVRYVTYPLNLLVSPKSRLDLQYFDNQWIAADAYFISDSGTLDMFGTTFTLDYADFYINHELNDYRLRGIFYKYASDGSLITLEIFNETNGNSSDILENMQFLLRSDNPEDRTTLHVLSKLRYNQRFEDIPRSEQNALLQDEFLQLAGIGLSGAFVDPLIYPFINRTRRILKLDYFSIRPSLVENLVRAYGFTEQTKEPEEESQIIQFGKNIILNNLSITMGKLIRRDLFLDYELLLQKPVDVVDRRDLLFYHNFTLHYNLPYRLRLAFRYYFKPDQEKDSQEVFIRRSFSFW